MDRNGKKSKAVRSEASRQAERSDMKASTRDVLGRADGGPAAGGGKGGGSAPDGPARRGRKGQHG